MDRAAKKAKKRQKREQKRRQMQKQQSVSPHHIVETASQVVECRINTDWRDNGMGTLLVLRESRTLGLCLSLYLIDFWCAGLKDAFGYFGITRADYRSIQERSASTHDGDFVTITPERATQLVAGAIRFGRQNGFRIGGDVLKWTSFVPGMSPETAELGDFGFVDHDGKRGLHWVGPIEDLRRRLIGSSVEEFIARPDVHYTMEVPEHELPREEIEEDQESEELLESMLVSFNHVVPRIVRIARARMAEDVSIRDEDLTFAARTLLLGSLQVLAGPDEHTSAELQEAPASTVALHLARERIEESFAGEDRAKVLRALDALGKIMRDPAAQEELRMSMGTGAFPALIEPDGRPSDTVERG